MFYMNMRAFDESSGEHGLVGRIAKEKYEQEKRKNDKEENSEKRKMYRRAGYEDKLPELDREYEKELKTTMKKDYDMRHPVRGKVDIDAKNYTRSNMYDRGHSIGTRAGDNIGYEYYKRSEENRDKINSKLHDRINNRTKHESAGIFESVEII